MQKIEIQAQPRTVTGRASKHLRQQGILPAVLYGHGFKSLPLQVSMKDFEKTLDMAGESTLVYVRVGDQQYPVIIHDVARDARDESVLHADFYKVKLDEKIKAKIQIVFAGEAPAVKNFGGILVKNINELEVEGLPQNLPHELTIDLASLDEIGKQITVKDIAISSDITLMVPADKIVALVQAPMSEEELKKQLETTAAPLADEVEVIRKEKKPGDEATEEAGAAPAGANFPADKAKEKGK
jgi:large subunit ribosomal protein L25